MKQWVFRQQTTSWLLWKQKINIKLRMGAWQTLTVFLRRNTLTFILMNSEEKVQKMCS